MRLELGSGSLGLFTSYLHYIGGIFWDDTCFTDDKTLCAGYDLLDIVHGR
jgi:hypothetical protein